MQPVCKIAFAVLVLCWSETRSPPEIYKAFENEMLEMVFDQKERKATEDWRYYMRNFIICKKGKANPVTGQGGS
jgi:hypothetical protein